MAYIDSTYYSQTFGGSVIPASDFPRMAEIASDIVDCLCAYKIPDAMLTNEKFLRAVCYQTELVYAQGGVDAISGMSEASQSGGSESLGDYSVSGGSGYSSTNTDSQISMIYGIPVSPLTLMILTRLGLRSAWVYAGDPRRGG